MSKLYEFNLDASSDEVIKDYIRDWHELEEDEELIQADLNLRDHQMRITVATLIELREVKSLLKEVIQQVK